MQEAHRCPDCGKWFLGLHEVNQHTHRYMVIRTRCKSWDCPFCRQFKAADYLERIKRLFDGRQLFFYTFTYFHSKPPEVVWSEYSTAWNRLRTAAVKRYGSFAYVRVLESHNLSPYPHLHVVTDKQFEVGWLGKELLRAGFGYQCDQKPITSTGAATYVAKYLTKEWSNEEGKKWRKALRLRIISFGGFDSSRANLAKFWSVVTGCRDYKECLERTRIHSEWNVGACAEVTFTQEFQDFFEMTIVEREENHVEGIVSGQLSVP